MPGAVAAAPARSRPKELTMEYLHTQGISLPRLGAADLSRSYLVCLQDRSFPPRISRQQARRLGVQPLTIDTSHSPFLSKPTLLAGLLVRAVATSPIRPLTTADDVPDAAASNRS